jgi:hypothetical protein
LRWPRDTLYPQKLALASLTSGGRSVGIVRLRTTSHGVLVFLYTVGRTPWTGDQLVTRPLSTHRMTHRINAHNTYIHALSGIRTYDHSVRASEDSSCFRPRGHCDRPTYILWYKKWQMTDFSWELVWYYMKDFLVKWMELKYSSSTSSWS